MSSKSLPIIQQSLSQCVAPNRTVVQWPDHTRPGHILTVGIPNVQIDNGDSPSLGNNCLLARPTYALNTFFARTQQIGATYWEPLHFCSLHDWCIVWTADTLWCKQAVSCLCTYLCLFEPQFYVLALSLSEMIPVTLFLRQQEDFLNLINWWEER